MAGSSSFQKRQCRSERPAWSGEFAVLNAKIADDERFSVTGRVKQKADSEHPGCPCASGLFVGREALAKRPKV